MEKKTQWTLVGAASVLGLGVASLTAVGAANAIGFISNGVLPEVPGISVGDDRQSSGIPSALAPAPGATDSAQPSAPSAVTPPTPLSPPSAASAPSPVSPPSAPTPPSPASPPSAPSPVSVDSPASVDSPESADSSD